MTSPLRRSSRIDRKVGLVGDTFVVGSVVSALLVIVVVRVLT
jgi:hypothetical protein